MSTASAQTKSAKVADVKKDWYLIDATDLVLGRMASEAAKILRGKHKPTYTPHVDCGDNIIVINSDKVTLKGNKLTDKKYYRHTGHPGGIKETTPEKLINSGKSARVVEQAVKRMISRNKLGSKQVSNLYVYSGETHPHEAQKPIKLDIAGQNPKNNKFRPQDN